MGSGRWTRLQRYMLNGEDLRNVLREGSPEAEIEARR